MAVKSVRREMGYGQGGGNVGGKGVEGKWVEAKIKTGERCTHAQVHVNGGVRVGTELAVLKGVAQSS